jgi:hypothetical protein
VASKGLLGPAPKVGGSSADTVTWQGGLEMGGLSHAWAPEVCWEARDCKGAFTARKHVGQQVPDHALAVWWGRFRPGESRVGPAAHREVPGCRVAGGVGGGACDLAGMGQ